MVGDEPLQRGAAGPAHVVGPTADDLAAVAVARYQPELGRDHRQVVRRDSAARARSAAISRARDGSSAPTSTAKSRYAWRPGISFRHLATSVAAWETSPRRSAILARRKMSSGPASAGRAGNWSHRRSRTRCAVAWDPRVRPPPAPPGRIQ